MDSIDFRRSISPDKKKERRVNKNICENFKPFKFGLNAIRHSSRARVFSLCATHLFVIHIGIGNRTGRSQDKKKENRISVRGQF